ncbi:MAG: hypothetical protein ACQET8_23255 [Bacillota bacterium]
MSVEIKIGDVFTRLTVSDIEYGIRGKKLLSANVNAAQSLNLKKIV